ncbi:hypothetical protein TNCV_3556241 [Trichonephila clavipes]|nr:hypothetical protein TNCV_3556241 [Trichonephila clavipes]
MYSAYTTWAHIEYSSSLKSSFEVGGMGRGVWGSEFNSSLSPAREQQAESSPETTQQQSSSQKSSKPRSRSLIRRTSKKSNKLKDPAATPGCSADGECHIS